MMDEDITSLDTEELRELVEETEEQYDQVASFVRDATVDHGEMTYRKMLSSRSKARWELDGFHGFDLEFRSGMDGIYSRDMEIHHDGEPVVHLHYPVKGGGR
ncbi:MAG: hypothetical protein SVU32_08555 [Candidatus Nanohaloarchaea archaeon]|nr:hypothetical protein [Candidatus Nanohaloarchaea archaeon]